jgi:hypothetical protein
MVKNTGWYVGEDFFINDAITHSTKYDKNATRTHLFKSSKSIRKTKTNT